MIISGAGGHALEVLEEWKKILPNENFLFFDELNQDESLLLNTFSVLHKQQELKEVFSYSNSFSLGVGSPKIRSRFYEMFSQAGGKFNPLHAKSSQVSDTASGEFDVMAFAYVGPQCSIGNGALVNTRANVHHECILGDFVEVGPGALILGQVHLEKFVRIGAGAVILPGLKVGAYSVVGAGAVVTKDIAKAITVKGIPAK